MNGNWPSAATPAELAQMLDALGRRLASPAELSVVAAAADMIRRQERALSEGANRIAVDTKTLAKSVRKTRRLLTKVLTEWESGTHPEKSWAQSLRAEARAALAKNPEGGHEQTTEAHRQLAQPDAEVQRAVTVHSQFHSEKP
jgi:hypothetical protein